MVQKVSQQYSTKIIAVCDYISAHLDHELNVENLSQVAHFSKYHFHRQFQVFTGVNKLKNRRSPVAKHLECLLTTLTPLNQSSSTLISVAL